MAYKFRDSDYINAIEFTKSELDTVTRSHVKSCDTDTDNPIDRRLECISIEYLWRRDTNGNKYKLGIITLENYQLIPVLGEHLNSYLSWFENYTGVERTEQKLTPKNWHDRLSESVDINPLYVVSAFRSPLQ